MSWSDRSTEVAQLPTPLELRRFVLENVSSGNRFASTGPKCSVGSHPSNDLTVEERTVSRFHCEIETLPDGAWLRDLGSRNGTLVDGLHVKEVRLRSGSTIQVGKLPLQFQYGHEEDLVAVSGESSFGTLLGVSVPMRAAFHLLERGAPSNATMLLEGETGTGKDAAAESIHAQSPRAAQPFVVMDCSAVPSNLIVSELFGHEKGAFTGAQTRRTGAFEAANGGTVFLDEIGELPLDMQPKLLRVLENRSIRLAVLKVTLPPLRERPEDIPHIAERILMQLGATVGAVERTAVDVRIIAATNRDLRVQVNEGAFRADLYYRRRVARRASLRSVHQEATDRGMAR